MKIDIRLELTFLLTILMVLLLNCGKSSRDLTTPSKMIVGHWITEGEYSFSHYRFRMDMFKIGPEDIKDTTVIEIPDGIYQIHLYIGPIDTMTNRGSYIYTARKNEDGNIEGVFEYKITEEWADWTGVKVRYWNKHGDTMGGSYKISKDGKEMVPLTISNPKYFNYLSDVQRFILGVQGRGLMNEKIFKYVDDEIRPSG